MHLHRFLFPHVLSKTPVFPRRLSSRHPPAEETPTEDQVPRHISPNARVPAAFPIWRAPIWRAILYALHPVRLPAAKSVHSPKHLQETCPRILPLRHAPEWPDPKRAEPCLERQL